MQGYSFIEKRYQVSENKLQPFSQKKPSNNMENNFQANNSKPEQNCQNITSIFCH